MAIQKKTVPTKSEKKAEAASQPTKAGKPSTKIDSSDAITPSMSVRS